MNEIYFAINTITLLLSGALVMFAAGGNALYQSGLARAHASSCICMMALGGAAVAMLTFYVIGYNVMFSHLNLFFHATNDGGVYAPEALWFFRTAAAAFAASIIGGALSERIKVMPYLAFIGLFSGVIYPLAAAWSWGGGWLSQFGFHDVAGAGVINLTAGCAALAGIHVLGPRGGRYAPDGRPIPFPGSNIPIAVLGTVMITLGWFGLVAGGAILQGASASGVAIAFMNLMLAGSAGCIAAYWQARLRYGKPDITIALNGLIAGLVAVSAAPELYAPFEAALIGAIGGALCASVVPFLDKIKIDDVSGVIPSNLVGGAWGVIAAIVGTGAVLQQVVGLVTIFLFASIASWIAWGLLKRTIGVRCAERAERHGLDMYELGHEAYPDFPIRTAGRPDITYLDRY